jgi:hypothetical protein
VDTMAAMAAGLGVATGVVVRAAAAMEVAEMAVGLVPQVVVAMAHQRRTTVHARCRCAL